MTLPTTFTASRAAALCACLLAAPAQAPKRREAGQ